MRFAIPKFDPTATTSGQVNNPLPQNQQVDGSYGFLLWANESSVSLLVQVNGDRFRIHPWELARIDFKEPTQFVQWAQEVILTNNASAPISLCLIDAYTPDEQISTAFPVPLVRNTNVGGTVTTAMTATLINDGSAAGTVIIETTPTGEATSAFSLDNSGNLVLRTLSSSVWSIIMQVISGGASPATANFHGNADTATSATNNVLKAGDTMSGALAIDIATGGSNVRVLTTNNTGGTTADWSLDYEASTGALFFFDNTSSKLALKMYINGQIGLSGMGTNGLTGIGTFTGAATGTYTHGMSVTPTSCSALQNVASATNTYGSDTFGSTTIHINVNASPQAFTAIVAK